MENPQKKGSNEYLKHMYKILIEFVFFLLALGVFGYCSKNSKQISTAFPIIQCNENNGVFERTYYMIHSSGSDTNDYYYAVDKYKYEGNKYRYCFRINVVQQGYGAEHSKCRITIEESEFEDFADFLNRCMNAPASTETLATKVISYQVISGRGTFEYFNNNFEFMDYEDRSYYFYSSISDIKNYFAGAKEKIKELKAAE